LQYCLYDFIINVISPKHLVCLSEDVFQSGQRCLVSALTENTKDKSSNEPNINQLSTGMLVVSRTNLELG